MFSRIRLSGGGRSPVRVIMGVVAQKHQNYFPRSSFRIAIAIADAPGTLHHVKGRGIAGTRIFRKDTDREDFLSRLGERREDGISGCGGGAVSGCNDIGGNPSGLFGGTA